jgi:hypothetical protein
MEVLGQPKLESSVKTTFSTSKKLGVIAHTLSVYRRIEVQAGPSINNSQFKK